MRKGGEVSFEVVFRDTDGQQRRRRLKATTERDALREARAILASRDGGDRIVAAKLSVREFAESEWLPLIDSLADAGRRSERGVALDRGSWTRYIEPREKGDELRAVGHMPCPDRVDGAGGDEVLALLPFLHQLDEGGQALICFT